MKQTLWSDGRPFGRLRAGSCGSSTKLAMHCVFALTLLLALVIPSMAGQVVDRVVSNVNGHVVLQSDWEQEVAFEALSDGRDLDSFTLAERKAALDRLVDQELLREQVRPGAARARGTGRRAGRRGSQASSRVRHR